MGLWPNGLRHEISNLAIPRSSRGRPSKGDEMDIDTINEIDHALAIARNHWYDKLRNAADAWSADSFLAKVERIEKTQQAFNKWKQENKE